ncbi:MAG TPA: regulatory protein RecX [Thermoanaerobaculia bacterium]
MPDRIRSSPSAHEKALQLLAARAHFRAELAKKLAARGYADDEIGAALDRLAAEGYLDDVKAAADFVAGRLAKGALGRTRLRAELQARGAAAGAIDAALAALPDDDLPAAREAASRYVRSQRGGRFDPAALARHLARKGFSRRAIVALLRETGSGDDVPPED